MLTNTSNKQRHVLNAWTYNNDLTLWHSMTCSRFQDTEESCLKARVVEPISIVSIAHRVYHTWYTLWLVNFACLLQHVRQSFAVLLPDSNKHVEHVKPSYTAPFDVLTFEILSRETVFQEVGVFEYLKRWLKAASFFLPTFFRSFAILLLARFFPGAHWPKVWHRLGTHILAGSNSGLFFLRCSTKLVKLGQLDYL